MAEENKNLNEELKNESTESPATESSDGMAENGTDVQRESQNTEGVQQAESQSAVSAEPAESEASAGNTQSAPVGETNVKSSRRQTILLIGIALIIIGIIFIVIALTQPRTVTTTEVTYSSASSTATDSDSSSSDSSSSDSDSSSGSSSSSSGTTTASETTTDENYVINLNTCTADDLTVLDGIGDAKASAIIAYRETLGGYTSVEQIKNISGIGDTTYENIKDHLTV